jgi:hypothetical protein
MRQVSIRFSTATRWRALAGSMTNLADHGLGSVGPCTDSAGKNGCREMRGGAHQNGRIEFFADLVSEAGEGTGFSLSPGSNIGTWQFGGAAVLRRPEECISGRHNHCTSPGRCRVVKGVGCDVAPTYGHQSPGVAETALIPTSSATFVRRWRHRHQQYIFSVLYWGA